MSRTVGVEEEFLLYDVERPVLVTRGEAVAERVDRRSDGQFEHEFKRQQVELGTAPHRDLAALGSELRDRRAELAAGAATYGGRIVAAGTSPVPAVAQTTEEERYEHMSAAFGETARTALSCGMHVHVGVDSRDEGVRALNGIRSWLPVLLALSANSPFHDGRDTGYASYRSMVWQQWPTAGAFGLFADVADYDATVRDVIESGAAMDIGMIYFDARLSANYPTVEIRIADVCPRVEDAVLLAGMCRALVDTAATDSASEPGRSERVEVLRGATWRAARYGLDDTLWHPITARQEPAWDVVDALVERLPSGPDTAWLRAGLADVRRRGTGSSLQRAVHSSTADLGAVVDALADCTLQL